MTGQYRVGQESPFPPKIDLEVCDVKSHTANQLSFEVREKNERITFYHDATIENVILKW